MLNVAPSAFVQMVAVERETCALMVLSEDRRGMLFLAAGVLWDAECGESRGEAAAIEILGWDVADVAMQAFDDPAERVIEAPLTFLLLEAMRRKDEGLDGEPVLPESLLGALVREHDGLLASCLVDVPTGSFLEEHFAAAPSFDGVPLSRSCYDLARAGQALTAGLGMTSELEQVALTFDDLLLVLRFLRPDLLLILIADPARMGLPAVNAVLRRLDFKELPAWPG